MEFSEMLKKILSSSHWTQEQLAAKLGVTFATVNSWVNGRTKPQKSLIPDIQKLYLAQDVTKEPEPIYITLVNISESLKVGDYILLEKDYDNKYDDEAIMAYSLNEGLNPVVLEDLNKNNEDEKWHDKVEEIRVYMGELQTEGYPRPMHVANSVNTVVHGTRSAGRIYDRFNLKARAQVVFISKTNAIARIVEWNYEG